MEELKSNKALVCGILVAAPLIVALSKIVHGQVPEAEVAAFNHLGSAALNVTGTIGGHHPFSLWDMADQSSHTAHALSNILLPKQAPVSDHSGLSTVLGKLKVEALNTAKVLGAQVNTREENSLKALKEAGFRSASALKNMTQIPPAP